MTLISMTDDMLLGMPEIDAQHQELVNRVSELLMMPERASFVTEVEKTLNFLGEYVIKHFQDEEAVQEQIGFPEREEHKQTHKEFLNRFDKLKQEFDEKGHSTILALNINSSIIQWVINHIKEEDSKIGKFYREQQGL